MHAACQSRRGIRHGDENSRKTAAEAAQKNFSGVLRGDPTTHHNGDRHTAATRAKTGFRPGFMGFSPGW